MAIFTPRTSSKSFQTLHARRRGWSCFWLNAIGLVAVTPALSLAQGPLPAAIDGTEEVAELAKSGWDSLYPFMMLGAAGCLVAIILGITNKQQKLAAYGAIGLGAITAIQWSFLAGLVILGGGALAYIMRPLEIEEAMEKVEPRRRRELRGQAGSPLTSSPSDYSRLDLRASEGEIRGGETAVPEYKEQAFSGKLSRPL